MSDTARFVRVLARKDVLALAFGAMIGWGWVVMTGHWIITAGSLGAVLAFIVGGLAIVCVGLTYAELAAAMPEAGGEHVYSCLLYTSPSPRDKRQSRMPSSA